MGILVCGLNGVGKSTLGRLLADRIGYTFIDSEDLFFSSADTNYPYSNPRRKDKVIRLLEEKISDNRRFIFAAVKGNYGPRLISSLDHIVLIEAPRQIRLQRVLTRSYSLFGERILPGGDLYEKEKAWFSLIEKRPENDTVQWLETIHCPVFRVDGTLPVEKNVEYLVSKLPVRRTEGSIGAL